MNILGLFIGLVVGALSSIVRVFIDTLLSVFAYSRDLFGRRLYLTLKMSYVVVAVLIVVCVLVTVVRYRFMTNYSRLPVDPSSCEDGSVLADLWRAEAEDIPDKARKPAYATYFDEFLRAIQVLGPLDKKVFHGLTRQMRTHRLEAEESVDLTDLDGFALVIEGEALLYKREHGDEPKYQLLNEINRAAPISSLLSVLSLFTRDLKLKSLFSTNLPEKNIPDVDLTAKKAPAAEPLADLEAFMRDVVLVAKTDCTIAIIPSESFASVAKVNPLSTGSILQFVLMRWARITLATTENYIDMTSALFSLEMNLNNRTSTALPEWLVGGALQRLRTMAHSDPETPRVCLRSRKKHDEELDGVDLDHLVDPSYPGDLLSNVPITSSKPLETLKTTPKTPFRPVRTPSVTVTLSSLFLLGNERPLGASETEVGILRKALVEAMFEKLGFDSVLKYPEDPVESPQLSSKTKFGFGALANTGLSLRPATPETMSEKSETAPEELPYHKVIEQAADMVSIVLYRGGEILSRRGSRANGLLYVVDGALSVYQTHKGVRKHIYDVPPGSVAGYLQTVMSYTALVDIEAKADTCVAILSREHYEKLADRYPIIYHSVVKTILSLLPTPLVYLDYAIDWVSLDAGGSLYRAGQDADSLYIVLNGRIRLYTEQNKNEHLKVSSEKGESILSEHGQGSSIGQLETLIGEKYSSSAVAARETELVKIPRTLMETLTPMFPTIPFDMARIVANSVRKKNSVESRALNGVNANFCTIAVLPTILGLPAQEFAERLSHAMRTNNRSTIVLSNSDILGYLGRHAFSRIGSMKLKTYLSALEQQYDTVLYVADSGPRADWSSMCVNQADCILLLADAESAPVFSDYERLVAQNKAYTRAHLILLHNEPWVVPGSTARWLKHRPWVTDHHHIQMELNYAKRRVETESHKQGMKGKSLEKLRQLQDKVRDEIFSRQGPKKRYLPRGNTYKYKNDFSRLARILSGEAIGLVLGGGGARGIAHVGVLRALEEAGVPIDIVGGTSIGSFVGGLYAREYNMVTIYGRAKRFASRVSSFWRLALDLTYPTTSYTTGHEFNRGVWKSFGDARIEDFWLKYFTNTTNLTHSRMDIHKSGYAWRYIRASMSLAGLVPPIEDKGDMLLDGGYMDNLTVNEMKRCGAKYIIAVDVGSIDNTSPVYYGDTLSGLWVLLNRWNPFHQGAKLPNLAEIQGRLASVSSVQALNEAKVMRDVVYLRPPIDGYATLEFNKFDEILGVGYAHAVRTLRELSLDGKLPILSSNLDGARPIISRFRRHSI